MGFRVEAREKVQHVWEPGLRGVFSYGVCCHSLAYRTRKGRDDRRRATPASLNFNNLPREPCSLPLKWI